MKVIFVKSARKDIYKTGKTIPHLIKKGKMLGQTIYIVDLSQPRDESDTAVVKKGESYYFWKFKNRPKQVSKTQPHHDQLRRYPKTEFEENTEDYQSRLSSTEDFEECEQLHSDVEEYRDELQERLDNMPQQLQESSILNEYIEQLDELLAEIESKKDELEEEN